VIETQLDCSESGGGYLGDGSTCDPNPCLPPCDCGFEPNFDGPDDHRRFLTLDWSQSIMLISGTTGDAMCHGEYDPDTCVLTATGSRNINGVHFCDCNEECGGSEPCSCDGTGSYAGCDYRQMVSVSGTTRTTTYDVCCPPGPCGTCPTECGTTTEVYSNECSPSGFAAPP
jgi:hypothetical protein